MCIPSGPGLALKTPLKFGFCGPDRLARLYNDCPGVRTQDYDLYVLPKQKFNDTTTSTAASPDTCQTSPSLKDINTAQAGCMHGPRSHCSLDIRLAHPAAYVPQSRRM